MHHQVSCNLLADFVPVLLSNVTWQLIVVDVTVPPSSRVCCKLARVIFRSTQRSLISADFGWVLKSRGKQMHLEILKDCLHLIWTFSVILAWSYTQSTDGYCALTAFPHWHTVFYPFIETLSWFFEWTFYLNDVWGKGVGPQESVSHLSSPTASLMTTYKVCEIGFHGFL